MFGMIYETFLRPASQRAGTAVGTFLAAQGIASDDISVLVAAFPVAVGVVWDLVVRRLY